MIPVSLQNLLLNTLFRCRYRVMTGSDGGLDACIGGPAIRQRVVAAQRCYPRLKRIRVLLVIVAERTVSFLWATFHHVCGIRDRKDQIYPHRRDLVLTLQVRLV